jgi:hypothetical protein
MFIICVVVEGDARTCSGGSQVAVSKVVRRGVSPPFDTSPNHIAGHFVCRLSCHRRRRREFSNKSPIEFESNEARRRIQKSLEWSVLVLGIGILPANSFVKYVSLLLVSRSKEKIDAAVAEHERQRNKRSTLQHSTF